MRKVLEARGLIEMGKDTSKPISFKTVQKNKKLGEFVEESERPQDQKSE